MLIPFCTLPFPVGDMMGTHSVTDEAPSIKAMDLAPLETRMRFRLPPLLSPLPLFTPSDLLLSCTGEVLNIYPKNCAPGALGDPHSFTGTQTLLTFLIHGG